MKGADVKYDEIKVGQLWRYFDNGSEVILEILDRGNHIGGIKCKTVQKIKGYIEIGRIDTWSFNYGIGNYEYLEGQDRPS